MTIDDGRIDETIRERQRARPVPVPVAPEYRLAIGLIRTCVAFQQTKYIVTKRLKTTKTPRRCPSRRGSGLRASQSICRASRPAGPGATPAHGAARAALAHRLERSSGGHGDGPRILEMARAVRSRQHARSAEEGARARRTRGCRSSAASAASADSSSRPMRASADRAPARTSADHRASSSGASAARARCRRSRAPARS